MYKDKEKQKITRKKYLEKNKDKISIKRKEKYELNGESIRKKSRLNNWKTKDYRKDYYQNHKDEKRIKANEYTKRKRKEDVQYKLAFTLRCRLNTALNKDEKTGSFVGDLGCTITELKIHLENQFTEGMNWDNWTTDGWHIDHIKPLASFDLTDREQLLEACHYTNLQPLWCHDNLIKGASVPPEICTI